MKNINEIKIAALTENLCAVQCFVSDTFAKLNCFTPQTMNQIYIIVEEVFVNISLYAYTPDKGDAIIRISEGKDVRIEFEDTGKPYNPLTCTEPDITMSGENRKIGGLGIFMVKKLTKGTAYRRDGARNILTLTVGGNNE